MAMLQNKLSQQIQKAKKDVPLVSVTSHTVSEISAQEISQFEASFNEVPRVNTSLESDLKREMKQILSFHLL